MASISDQIRRVQLKKSPEQQAREASEARRERAKLANKLKDQRKGGSVMDPAFTRQLKAKAAAVSAGQPKVRGDLPDALAKLRLEGKLPPEGGPIRVGYVPTPEEVLGDEALPKATDPGEPETADIDCPPATTVLGGFTEEELAEIDRMNPPRKGQKRASKR
jgi:hypothetical protein